MLFGMGTVVLFLSLLVVVTGAMSALVKRFAPMEETTPPAPEKRQAPADAVLLAVIAAAIHKHRSGNKS